MVGSGRLRLLAALATAFAIVTLVGDGFLLLGGLPSGNSGPSQPETKTAVIVDQLSLTVPNPEFVRSARETLKDAGYAVDHFPGQHATVNFYRELPTRGYDLILLRVHSARLLDPGRGEFQDEVALFTSEPYSQTRYTDEQRAGRIGLTAYPGHPEQYFGLMSGFIRSDMNGDFDGATIVMMGCSGLRSDLLGDAFLQRGARNFIGWNELVSAAHTDVSTGRLLELLLEDSLPPHAAVAHTRWDVGADPATQAELRILSDDG